MRLGNRAGPPTTSYVILHEVIALIRWVLDDGARTRRLAFLLVLVVILISSSAPAILDVAALVRGR
jgi:hypothetical protein